MRYTAVIIIIIIVIITISLAWNYLRDISTTENKTVFESQTSEADGVVITVKPLFSVDEKTSFWNFQLTLDTHSTELSEDLTAASLLLDETGRTYQPITWEGDPPGGHHRQGILKFRSITPQPKSITLKLERFSKTNQVFTWQIEQIK